MFDSNRLYCNKSCTKSADNGDRELATSGFSVDSQAVLMALQSFAKGPSRQTPLIVSNELAGTFNIANLYLKAEVDRMGLGSFKAVGGGFAVAELILRNARATLGDDIGYKNLTDPQVRAIAEKMTFVCASAGNHGMAVANGAAHFGAKAVIFVAETVPKPFINRLEKIGAEVRVSGKDYEQSMANALQLAEQNDWILLADSSWPGYMDIPGLVMQGYSVIGDEISSQMDELNTVPTHIFLQAGVGGMAGAFAACARKKWGRSNKQPFPKIVVVEPEAAPCLMASVKAGEITIAEGPVSCMGRLDCKEPSLLAFEYLAKEADAFMVISDSEAEQAAAKLSAQGLPTTPSGAAGFAGLTMAAQDKQLRDALGLDNSSQVLLVVSEGAL